MKLTSLTKRDSIPAIARLFKKTIKTIRCAIQCDQYAGTQTEQRSQQRRHLSRSVRGLHADFIVVGSTQNFIQMRWVFHQFTLTLAFFNPKRHELRVSTDTIYNCIYAQPVSGTSSRDNFWLTEKSVRFRHGWLSTGAYSRVGINNPT